MRLPRAGVLLFALALLACSKSESAPEGAKSAAPAPASAPRSSAPVASASAPAPAKPSTESWTGTYEAQLYTIETPKNEGAREWAQDDGGMHSGKGKLALAVNEHGQVSGTASGPLGEQRITGARDEGELRIRFLPKEGGDRAFSGTAVLKREGDAWKGSLQASTGDSRTVRDAPIVLERGGAPEGVGPAPSASAH